jgi:heterodisulfide reductase subunit A-like polyferredoxin
MNRKEAEPECRGRNCLQRVRGLRSFVARHVRLPALPQCGHQPRVRAHPVLLRTLRGPSGAALGSQGAEKIAWLQCIGSRDVHIGARGYCSSVCCTYAIKEAMLAKEHSKSLGHRHFLHGHPHARQGFRTLFQPRPGWPPGSASSNRESRNVVENGNGNQLIRYVDAAGKRVEEAFDIVVLSVGLGIKGGARAGPTPGHRDRRYGFARTSGFEPVKTSACRHLCLRRH